MVASIMSLDKYRPISENTSLIPAESGSENRKPICDGYNRVNISTFVFLL